VTLLFHLRESFPGFPPVGILSLHPVHIEGLRSGATPWTKWSRRFSLRTLLIATTLIAVVLGLVVYVARQ